METTNQQLIWENLISKNAVRRRWTDERRISQHRNAD
jgi:hypothetical protein